MVANATSVVETPEIFDPLMPCYQTYINDRLITTYEDIDLDLY